MENLQLQETQRPPSQQMRAVLTLLRADSCLFNAAIQWIDLETESIHWDQLFKMVLSSGHRNVLGWAYSIWTDEIRSKTNPFDEALSLEPALQAAVLQALAIRWGLK